MSHRAHQISHKEDGLGLEFRFGVWGSGLGFGLCKVIQAT